MIVLDLSILNQKGTPMFNSDTFANRPNFGIVGRIFISTDTKEFYRDTGTSWELIGGPGSGTITGSGAATQVAFWNGTSTISGSNNLWWDSTNNYLGINTNTPTTALDVHHSTNSGAIFNQTTATNNNTINFQTSGSGRWRIGNFYTAGADDFGIFDVVGSLQQFTILKTTGQTFIGAKTTASGRLVVNSATADNHLQIVGANAPSIRIDNAGSGGTQRFVFGLATATNNFIQGATAGEFCISTQSAGNMLFGMWQTTNASEVMRITTANNLLIGSSVDNGNRLQVYGTGYINNRLTIDGTSSSQYIQFHNSGVDRAHLYWSEGANSLTLGTYIAGGSIQFETDNNVDAAIIDSNGRFGIGTLTPLTRLDVRSSDLNNIFVTNPDTTGATTGSGIGFRAYNGTSVTQSAGIILTSNTWSFGTYSANQLSIGSDGTGGIGLRTANSAPITFFTGGTTAGLSTQKMTLNASGNLGINVTSPDSKLHVIGSGGASLRIDFVASGDNYYDGATHYFRNNNGAAGIMTLLNNGNVLIGSSTDQGKKLYLNGSLRIDGQTSGSAGGSSGQHLIINCDGTQYKIALLNN